MESVIPKDVRKSWRRVRQLFLLLFEGFFLIMEAVFVCADFAQEELPEVRCMRSLCIEVIWGSGGRRVCTALGPT